MVPTLTKSLLEDLNEWSRWADEAFARGGLTYPAINLYRGNDATLVVAEMPGVLLADIEIAVSGNQVTISGDRKAPERPEGAVELQHETFSGKFHRVIRLPHRVAADNVKARLEHGILTVELPVAEEEKPRKIRIES